MKKNGAIQAASDLVESTASWVFACLSLLLAMYGYLMDIIQFRWGGRLIPLTTCSWSEFRHANTTNTTDRYRQLVRLLEDELISTSKKGLDEKEWTDEQLVASIRGSLAARKLTSLLVMRHQLQHDPSSDRENRLCQRLRRLWPQLLRLPKNYAWRGDMTATPSPLSKKQEPNPKQQQSGNRDKVVLSLILPCYRECGLRLQKNLDKVRSRCTQPSRVEVVLVDAGGCRNFDRFAQEEEEEEQAEQQKKEKTGEANRWHSVRIVSYPDGGGRGPSLNCGAQHAKGDMYVFGHADTILPHRWDDDIVRSIRLDGAMACAFAFSIDSTCLDTEPQPKQSQQQQLPGIRAVEWLVNCRTRYCLLPYGDQVLSMPRQVFDHVGGFPQQCIMEDFDLVRHLRLRSLQQGEKFRMIMANPVETSARRWQRLGVAHVTYTNAILVHQYTHGKLSPSQLFQAYYGRPPSSSSSPPMATPND